MAMKMVRTQKALSMGHAQDVSAATMTRSEGILPKMRTTCRNATSIADIVTV
jgi:hypothetical protein